MLISSDYRMPTVLANHTIENEKERQIIIIFMTIIPRGLKLPISPLNVSSPCQT